MEVHIPYCICMYLHISLYGEPSYAYPAEYISLQFRVVLADCNGTFLFLIQLLGKLNELLFHFKSVEPLQNNFLCFRFFW